MSATETILSPLGGRETRRRIDAYDAMGDHVLAVEAAGTTEETRTEYAWDGSGLLVSVSVGGAAPTTFEHDAAGNRVRVDSPHHGAATYEWTALGELRRRTDADGASTWAYDRLGRMVARDDPDGAARWTYDPPNAAGLLAARCRYVSSPRDDCGGGPAFEERAVYGPDARPSSATTTIRAGGETRKYRHAYAYDRFGRLAETTYPSGLKTRREYDARGYPTGLWTGRTLLQATKATDAWGSATLLEHLGGGRAEREFDPASGRPLAARTKAADGSVPMRQQYAWRTDAALAWREDAGALADGSAPRRRETFERDALGRVAEAWTKTGDEERRLSYAYDALGSLLSRGDTAAGGETLSTAGYGAGDRGPNAARYATTGGVRRELEHDALGRVTAYRACGSPTGKCERSPRDDDLFVKWNARGLAAEVAVGANRSGAVAQEVFAYGPDGARHYRESEWTEKDADGKEVRRRRRAYRVGAFEEALPDASSPWASVERTSLAGGAVLHVRATRRDGSVETTVRHLHSDQTGSPAAATGAKGGTLRRTAHDPYGARRAPDWTGTLDEAGLDALLADEDLGGAVGFGGHEQLDRVGLVDMAGRLYDPTLGRFLAPDPYVADIASSQDWNAYAYVGGRPASRTDPTGRIWAGPMCNLRGVICMQGDDAGGASSAAPARGWGALFGVDVSIGWVPTWTYDGFGGGGNERPSSLRGPTLAWTPVATWSVWALLFPVEAHGADERQAADEPMFSFGPFELDRGDVVPVTGLFLWRVPFVLSGRGYHWYERWSSPICRATACTFKDVIEAMNQVGAHPNQKVTFVPTKVHRADVNLAMWPWESVVETTALMKDKEQIGIVNSTIEGRHPLHLGTVERSPVLRDGSYHIRTVGKGDGPHGAFNVVFARSGLWNEGWYEVDQKVRDLLAR